jgi:hypothetical protein
VSTHTPAPRLQESLIIGATVDTRRIAQAARAVGNFDSLVPLVLTTTSSQRLALLAQNAQAALLEAQGNSDVLAAAVLKKAGAPAIQAIFDFSVRRPKCLTLTRSS